MCFMRSPVILLHIEEQLGTTNKTKEARMEPHELPRIRQTSKFKTKDYLKPNVNLGSEGVVLAKMGLGIDGVLGTMGVAGGGGAIVVAEGMEAEGFWSWISSADVSSRR